MPPTVADHGERLQVGRVFHRQHLQGIGAVAAGARLQAGAGEQGGQGFLQGVLAVQRLAASRGGLFRAEGDQHAGLAA